MAYLRAALLGFAVAVIVGAAFGAREYARTIHAASGTPEGKARAYAIGIATTLNCAAFYSLICVPGAIVVLLVKRKLAGP